MDIPEAPDAYTRKIGMTSPIVRAFVKSDFGEIASFCLKKGDIKPLSDHFEGLQRPRVGYNRVISEHEIIDGKRVITCIFAGSRKWVCDVFPLPHSYRLSVRPHR